MKTMKFYSLEKDNDCEDNFLQLDINIQALNLILYNNQKYRLIQKNQIEIIQ